MVGTVFVVALIVLQRRALSIPKGLTKPLPRSVSSTILGVAVMVLLVTGIAAYIVRLSADAGWSAVTIFVGVMLSAIYINRASVKAYEEASEAESTGRFYEA
jgi:hypothetical protein